MSVPRASGALMTCLIVEVLSETTQRIDRQEKFLAYQTLESLQEYTLVSQDRRQVEVFHRASAWRREVCKEGEVWLDCLGVDEMGKSRWDALRLSRAVDGSLGEPCGVALRCRHRRRPGLAA